MTAKDAKKRIFTIPNILSMFRIALIPIYVWIYLKAERKTDYHIATAIMAVSMITDAFDGIIARKCNMITTLGKVLDPVADKLTQVVVLVCLAIRFSPLWWVFGVFMVKETFMFVMGLLALSHGRMLNGALIAGKICTAVLFASMALLMLSPDMGHKPTVIISAIDIFVLLVSFFFYMSTYMGGKHGVDIISLRKDKKE